MKKIAIATLLSLGLLTGATGTHANGLSALFGQSAKQFLPVHEAFKPSIEQNGNQITVRFSVTPEHYIYQDKLVLKLPEGVVASDWQFDRASSFVDDPSFGRVAVFEQDFVAIAHLSTDKPLNNQTISLRWQGCAKAGLCYPPENTPLTINLTADKANQHKADGKSGEQKTAKTNQKQGELVTTLEKTADKTTISQTQQSTNPSQAVSANPSVNQDKTDDKSAEQATQNAQNDTAENKNPSPDVNPQTTQSPMDTPKADENALPTTYVPSETDGQNAYALNHTLPVSQQQQSNPVIFVLLLFLAGLLLSFTPCIYPMVPIVANIVAKQKSASAKRGFALSAAYGVGVATAYGALGAVVAWFGQALGLAGLLQRSEVLLAVAGLFVLFALMMADIVQIRLPSAISQRLQNQSQKADGYLGSVSGSFIAGALSALVVSPCVSAPMAGALTTVSMSGNVLFGFLALFALGIGLSVPLMVMGAAQGKFMPKAGAWTVKVRQLGALLLLAVALALVERVLLSPAMLALWAVWFGLLAFWAYRLTGVAKWLFVPAVIWSLALLYGLSQGATDAWRPLNVAQNTTGEQQYPDAKITTLAELDEILASKERVLVDVTADWCVECRIMERNIFANRSSVLKQYQVVKLDISETAGDSRAVLARYQLFGPPALLVYHQGELKHILLGETKADMLDQALSQF